MLVKLFREGLGRAIVFGNYVTLPKPKQRTEIEQNSVNEKAKQLALYQFYACPFCIRTRRAIHKLNIPIEIRDAQNDKEHRHTLLTQGGKLQVPCLTINENGKTRWLFESGDIIEYLSQQFERN
ncbi:MAG: glutathione S-transferase N-terminal domain-containing protein [Proteobacteria bacterium]|nr:glutathione S-transferase N-terminal domain-containing protein [Pseudomonadota bacterium]